jgi:hypothetical protein
MKPIYHPWHLWEDHKNGFYDNISGNRKKELAAKIVVLFCDTQRLQATMLDVVEKWPYSMEHNLSNANLNQIAYIGQCAACLSLGAPSTVTMEIWSTLDKNTRDAADKAATIALDEWQRKTNHQLCLNFI